MVKRVGTLLILMLLASSPAVRAEIILEDLTAAADNTEDALDSADTAYENAVESYNKVIDVYDRLEEISAKLTAISEGLQTLKSLYASGPTATNFETITTDLQESIDMLDLSKTDLNDSLDKSDEYFDDIDNVISSVEAADRIIRSHWQYD